MATRPGRRSVDRCQSVVDAVRLRTPRSSIVFFCSLGLAFDCRKKQKKIHRKNEKNKTKTKPDRHLVCSFTLRGVVVGVVAVVVVAVVVAVVAVARRRIPPVVLVSALDAGCVCVFFFLFMEHDDRRRCRRLTTTTTTTRASFFFFRLRASVPCVCVSRV